MADLLSRLKVQNSKQDAVEETEIGLFKNRLFTESNETRVKQTTHQVNMVEIDYNLPNLTVKQQLDSDLNQIINLIKARKIVFANKNYKRYCFNQININIY